jgi:hypothetical protein
LIEIDAGNVEQLKATKPNVVFSALHGRLCEDGVVRGCCAGWLRMPYTHSGVLLFSYGNGQAKTKTCMRAMTFRSWISVQPQSQTGRDGARACRPFNESPASEFIWLWKANPPKLTLICPIR